MDELLSGYENPEDLLGEERLFRQLKKALLERALGAELSDLLGYEKGDPAGRGTGNRRNGYSPSSVNTKYLTLSRRLLHWQLRIDAKIYTDEELRDDLCPSICR